MTILRQYLDYPHRNDTFNSKGYRILVPKEYRTDHPFATVYKEWKEILDTYMTLVVYYLLSGKPFRLPGNFGYLRLMKKRTSQQVDNIVRSVDIAARKNNMTWKEARKYVFEEKKFLPEYRPKTSGYKLKLVWTRHRNTKCGSIWLLWMPRHLLKLMYIYFTENPQKLDNLLEY